MRKRKSVGLWIAMFVGIVAQFASGEVWAASTGTPAGENVTLDGYIVTVVREGGFPAVADGDSIFKWNFSGTPAAKAIVNTINIKIPVEIEPSYDVLRSSLMDAVSIIPATGPGCTLSPFTLRNLTGWVLAPKGVGGLTTSIGKFEYDYYVLSIVPPRTGACAITKTTTNTKVQVKFNGKELKSSLNSFLVRASLLGEALNLLGPSMTGTSTPSAGGPLQTRLISFSLGSPKDWESDFKDCRMDVTFKTDGNTENVVTRSITNPSSTDPVTTCYEVLTPESIRKTIVCDKNNYTVNPDGSFSWPSFSEPTGVNCIQYEAGSYECKTKPDTINTTCTYDFNAGYYTCNSTTDLTPGCTLLDGTTYSCGSLPSESCNTTYPTDLYCLTGAALSNSCTFNYVDYTYICSLSPPPPGCDTTACSPTKNCAPRTAVSASGITKSDDNSKFCWNDTAGTQHCKTCTVVNGVTRCITQ
jgi:hypothetical protein